MHQIFVSYDPADQDFAMRLTTDLVAYGARVWLDVYDARPGRHWARSIARAYDESSMMIVILSPGALQSSRIAAEWQAYLEVYRPVMPVLAVPCEPPAPLFARRPVDFTRDRFYDRAFHALMNRLIDYSTRVRQQSANWAPVTYPDPYEPRDAGPRIEAPAAEQPVRYSDPDAAKTIRRVVQGLCARLGR